MNHVNDKKAGKWLRVSRVNPCPVCGKPDYCRLSRDGMNVHCMRLESNKPFGGPNAGGWIHPLDKSYTPKPEIWPNDELFQQERDWTALAAEAYRHPKAEDVRLGLSFELGVSIEALERLEVGYGCDAKGREYSTWPERRPGNKVVGITRRYEKPINGKNKLAMKGSKHGLYIPKDWWRERGPILVVEGGSDTAALLTLGLCVIGRPSNLGGVNMLLGLLKGSSHRPVIVIGERDRKDERVGSVSQCPGNCDGCSWCWPGRFGARVTAERLSVALGRGYRVLWRMVPKGAKDSREWLQQGGRTANQFLRRLTK